jgi:hypothetical protein
LLVKRDTGDFDPTLPANMGQAGGGNAMNATINFSSGPQNLTLGLVGFHMVINTALHPEFIWATIEHRSDDPNCNNPQTAPANGWDFTSAQAAQCLANGGINSCPQFKFNTGAPPTTPTGGVPSQVCRTMAVFANYPMEGALWTNGGMDSVTANQRGSLELANTTMETFKQIAPPGPNANCFGCHHFTTTAPLNVSHIYEATPAKAAALRRRAAAKKQ